MVPAEHVTLHPGICLRRVQEESPEVFIANRLSFPDLFDDILLMLSVRRLCVVVDAFLFLPRKCVIV